MIGSSSLHSIHLLFSLVAGKESAGTGAIDFMVMPFCTFLSISHHTRVIGQYIPQTHLKNHVLSTELCHELPLGPLDSVKYFRAPALMTKTNAT